MKKGRRKEWEMKYGGGCEWRREKIREKKKKRKKKKKMMGKGGCGVAMGALHSLDRVFWKNEGWKSNQEIEG